MSIQLAIAGLAFFSACSRGDASADPAAPAKSTSPKTAPARTYVKPPDEALRKSG